MKVNNFIIQPKNARKIVTCVIACLFAFCAFLVPFSAFKPVSADYIEDPGDSDSKSFFGLAPREVVGFIRLDDGTGRRYAVNSLTYNLEFDQGDLDGGYFDRRYNVRQFNVDIGGELVKVAESGFGVNSSLDQVGYYFDDFIFSDAGCHMNINYGAIRAVYSGVNDLEKRCSYYRILNTSNVDLQVSSYGMLYYINEDSTYIYDTLFMEYETTVSALGGTFSWLSNFYYNYKLFNYIDENGYIYIDQVNIYVSPVEGSPQGNYSCSFYVPLSLVLEDNFYTYDSISALAYFNEWKGNQYKDSGVEDIFSSMWRGIEAFFNTEFIPGFKIWYFLLIGLGCAVVGIALKFFLGG